MIVGSMFRGLALTKAWGAKDQDPATILQEVKLPHLWSCRSLGSCPCGADCSNELQQIRHVLVIHDGDAG